MMNLLIGMIKGLLLLGGYFGCYIGLIYLFSIGIFETDCFEKGIVKEHFIVKDGINSIRESVNVGIECIQYKKKWYQPYKNIDLPDRYIFDCEETKQIWEKFNANKI